jgi:hypothetical protein
MRQISVASILAALMCGAAATGYSAKAEVPPYRDVNLPDIWCPVGVPPCASNEHVGAGSPACAYPNEPSFVRRAQGLSRR